MSAPSLPRASQSHLPPMKIFNAVDRPLFAAINRPPQQLVDHDRFLGGKGEYSIQTYNSPPRPKPLSRKKGWQKLPPAHNRPIIDLHKRTESKTELQLFSTPTGEGRFKTIAELNQQQADFLNGTQTDADAPVSKKRKLQDDGSIELKPLKWSNPETYPSAPPVAASSGIVQNIMDLIYSRKRQNKVIKDNAKSDEVGANADFVAFEDKAPQPETTTRKRSRRKKKDSNCNQTVMNHSRGLNGSALFQTAETMPTSSKLKVLHSDQSSLNEAYCTDGQSLAEDPESEPSFQFTFRHTLPQGLSTSRTWSSTPGQSEMPWIDELASALRRDVKVGTAVMRLHKEICAFSDYSKPTEGERRVRANLMQSLAHKMAYKFPKCQLHAFGSYAADLYLPDSDMDFVILSSGNQGGDRVLNAKKCCYAATPILASLAADGKASAIARARIPIVKYTDARTALSVDISFEQDSGVRALPLLTQWASELPALEPLVRVVKQFLAMRNLNQVFNGGLGGFSAICLIVCFLQHTPLNRLGDGEGVASYNLGALLVYFFDFYGDEFNPGETAIIWEKPPNGLPGMQLRTKACFAKVRDSLRVHCYEPGKSPMVVADPFDSSNNLTHGSQRIGEVFRQFREVSRILRENMAYIETAAGARHFLLEPILGGNYQAWTSARTRYATLAEEIPRYVKFSGFLKLIPLPNFRAPPQVGKASKKRKQRSYGSV